MHSPQLTVNKTVGGILSLIISFSIPTLCALITFAYVHAYLPVPPVWPAAAVWLCAFLIASGVTEVFRCAIDTIFISAFQDLDSNMPPAYMSEALRVGFDLPSFAHSQEGVRLRRGSDERRESTPQNDNAKRVSVKARGEDGRPLRPSVSANV